MDGPMAIQLNTCLSSVALFARRPTCRCSAIMASPVAAPQVSAVTHSTPNTGKATAAAAPADAMPTAMATGFLSPRRSA
ncbi:hypothetical protein D9M69_588130 [compost metagenome]